MVGNSSKPSESGNQQVISLQVVQEWLDGEGGRDKASIGIAALLDSTADAMAGGDSPPEKDGATLVEFWRLAQGDREVSATPLRGSEYARWWRAREQHIRQACLDRGCVWLPRLAVRRGGGRNNPTMYAFELVPLASTEADESDDAWEEVAREGGLRYRVDPVKPALWIRVLLGTRPFRVDSWRGYVLIGSAVTNFVFIGLIWWAVLADWVRRPRPVTTGDLAIAALAFLVSWVLWRLTRPIRQLPTKRVALAHEAFLSMNTLHGQLRTMRDGKSKMSGRTFSIVRHWAICPICSAEIDLAEGGREFPGRLVGRCGNAPLEHVYSFDPVQLTGESLRRGCDAITTGG